MALLKGFYMWNKRYLLCFMLLTLTMAGYALPEPVPPMAAIADGVIPWMQQALDGEREFEELHLQPEPQLLEALLKALAGDDLRESSNAAYFLGIFKETRALPGLIALLERKEQIQLDPQVDNLPGERDENDLHLLATHRLFASAYPMRDAILGPFNLHTAYREAIIALGALSADPAAREALLGTLTSDNPYIRLVGTAVLGEMQHPAAIKPLLAIIETPNNRSRESAIRMLGAIKDPAATQALIALGEGNAGGNATGELIAQLAIIGAPAVKALVTLVTGNAQSYYQYQATEALKKIKDPQTIPLLAEGLTSPNVDIRVRVILALGWLGDPQALPLIRKVASDTEERVREAVIDSLPAIAGADLFQDLLPLIKDDAYNVSSRAIRALADIGDTRAIPVLYNILKEHSDRSIVACAALGLGKLKATIAVPELIGMLDIAHASLHEACVQALAQIADPLAVEPLLRVMQTDPDPRVRRMAALGLVYTQKPEVETFFIADITTPDQYSYEIRLKAVNALATMTTPRVIEPLLNALNDENDQVREAAAQALAQRQEARAIPILIQLLFRKKGRMIPIIEDLAIYGAAAIDPLVTAFQTDEWPVTMWSMQALAKIKDPRCVPVYLKALTHKEYNVRSAALDGLKNISEQNFEFDLAKWQAWWDAQQ